MGFGTMGKVLWVDLSTGKIAEEKVPEKVYRQYLSGTGLGAYFLYDRIPAGADPLGPDNILGFLSGVLTGTGSLFTGRWMVVGKSPLTGTWGDANCGGDFSPAIKRCGYDGIFFRGISRKPVYLCIEKGKVTSVLRRARLNSGMRAMCGVGTRSRPKGISRKLQNVKIPGSPVLVRPAKNCR